MGPAEASARPLTCMYAPDPIENGQAYGREPGCMFANLQPNRRQLTWYSAAGRKGPWPSTPAIEHLDSKHREQRSGTLN